jgi:hypothetical protein
MRNVRYSTEAAKWRSDAWIEDHDSKRGFASMEEEEWREVPQKVAAEVAATCSKQRAGGGSWTKGR